MKTSHHLNAEHTQCNSVTLCRNIKEKLHQSFIRGSVLVCAEGAINTLSQRFILRFNTVPKWHLVYFHL